MSNESQEQCERWQYRLGHIVSARHSRDYLRHRKMASEFMSININFDPTADGKTIEIKSSVNADTICLTRLLSYRSDQHKH